MLKITGINAINFKNNIKTASGLNKDSIPCTSGQDVFIKTESCSFNAARIKELYDELYDEVMAQNIENNPILNDVTINKPEIAFQELDDDNFEAEYDVMENKIIFNAKYLNQDKYLITPCKKDGKSDTGWIGPRKYLLKSAKTIEKINPDIQIMKLTKEEKEITIKCILAHELRHCIQNHLKLSLENSNKELEDEHAEFTKIIEIFKKIDSGVSEYTAYRCNDMYAMAYKPKKLLPKDTKFKVSLNKNDNRYWSVYDDFISSRKSIYTNGKIDKDKYLSSKEEIDAYGYEYEYLLSKLPEYKSKNIRNDFLICFGSYLFNNFNR